jgi:hypothetical protein
MPLPNVYVISAIIESYLTLKKDDWNFENKDTGKLNLSSLGAKPATKVDSCKKILEKISGDELGIDDWIKLACMLHDAEITEKQTHDNRFWFTKTFIVNSPLLLDTLRAIRSYILTSLKDFPEYQEKLQAVINWQEKSEGDVTRLRDHRNKHKLSEIDTAQDKLDKINTILSALDYPPVLEDLRQDYKSFYKSKILPLDPEAKKLHEDTFDDFVKNVYSQARTLPLCKKLLHAIHSARVAANEAPAISPQPDTTIQFTNPIQNEVAIVTAPTLANPVAPQPEVAQQPEAASIPEENVEAKAAPAPKKSRPPKPAHAEPVRRSARLQYKSATSSDHSPLKANSAFSSKPSTHRTKPTKVTFVSNEEPPQRSNRYKNH